MINNSTIEKFISYAGKNRFLPFKPVNYSAVKTSSLKYIGGLKDDVVEINAKQDLLNLPHNLIKKLMKNAVNDKNMCGKPGAEAVVYQIPGTKYAIRKKLLSKTDFNQKLDFNVSAQEKINRVVAKIDDTALIEFFEGSFPMKKSDVDFNHVSPKNLKSILKQMYDAAQVGMKHDMGGKNLIYNKADGSFKAIDFFIADANKQNQSLLQNFPIMLTGCINNTKDANIVLGNTMLAFLEGLKDGSFTKQGLKKFTLNIVKLCDLPSYRNNPFLNNLQTGMDKVMRLKNLQGLSPEIEKELSKEILEFEKLILKELGK